MQLHKWNDAPLEGIWPHLMGQLFRSELRIAEQKLFFFDWQETWHDFVQSRILNRQLHYTVHWADLEGQHCRIALRSTVVRY